MVFVPSLCNASRLCRHSSYLVQFLRLSYTNKNIINLHQNDSLYIYTDNLLKESNDKLQKFISNTVLKNLKYDSLSNITCQSEEYLSTLNVEELQCKIVDSIYNSDIDNALNLIRFCKHKRYCLHPDFIMYFIKLFANLGHKECVEELQLLFMLTNEKEFHRKCELKHYSAQVLWHKGNVNKAFELLERLYRNNLLRREINIVLYDIICSSVSKNEASLVLTTEFTQKLVDKYNDYFPIAILWKKLTESEWFADNQLAKQLFHCNKNLIVIVSPLIPLWSVRLIQHHKIDAVNRMCEVLLEHHQLQHYSSVLHSLFDYYYKKSNLKLCSAVVKSAADLDIPLRNNYYKRFLDLLTTGQPESKVSVSLPKTIECQINFKF